MALNVGNADVTVGAAAGIALNAAPGQSITFLKVTACNTDTVARTLSVFRVPNGGVSGAGNAIIDALPIGAGETVVLPLSGQSLVNQQSLSALADAGAVVNLNIGYATSS